MAIAGEDQDAWGKEPWITFLLSWFSLIPVYVCISSVVVGSSVSCLASILQLQVEPS